MRNGKIEHKGRIGMKEAWEELWDKNMDCSNADEKKEKFD